MIKLISFTFSLAASFRFLFQSTDPWFLHGIYLRYETVLFFKLLQKHTFQLQYKTKSFAWFWNEFSNFNENWCISNTKIHILPDFKSSQKVGESSYKVRKIFLEPRGVYLSNAPTLVIIRPLKKRNFDFSKNFLRDLGT